jgi:hypothetical protein
VSGVMGTCRSPAGDGVVASIGDTFSIPGFAVCCFAGHLELRAGITVSYTFLDK